MKQFPFLDNSSEPQVNLMEKFGQLIEYFQSNKISEGEKS
jgi:hypothetical protein